MISIDDRYTSRQPIYFLKVDIEGYEIQLLQGAIQNFYNMNIKNAFIEFNQKQYKDIGNNTNQDAIDILCEIHNFGYYEISWPLHNIRFENCDAIASFFNNDWEQNVSQYKLPASRDLLIKLT